MSAKTPCRGASGLKVILSTNIVPELLGILPDKGKHFLLDSVKLFLTDYAKGLLWDAWKREGAGIECEETPIDTASLRN